MRQKNRRNRSEKVKTERKDGKKQRGGREEKKGGGEGREKMEDKLRNWRKIVEFSIKRGKIPD